jgi:hypothetical protein
MASIVGVGAMGKPENMLEWAGAVNTVYQGASGAVDLATSIISPPP